MFLLSMALADLSVGAFGILNQILKYLFLVSGKVRSMDTWKLLGVLPFFGSVFMSIFSTGLITTDRIISVQYALRNNNIMTKLRATIPIALTWGATTIIIFIQGIIYLRISPQTELTVRHYLLNIFGFIGGITLVASNTKLYLMISAKLKKTSVTNSMKMRTPRDLEQNRKPVRRATTTKNSVKMITEHSSNQTGEEPTARIMTGNLITEAAVKTTVPATTKTENKNIKHDSKHSVEKKRQTHRETQRK